MSTYQARHAVVELEASSQRRLLMRGGLATAAATAFGGVGFLTPAFAAQPLLKLGSRGTAVRDLQTKLTKGGYKPGPADGIFGSGTRSAVIKLQGNRRLTKDGVVGPMTWAQVNKLGSGSSGPGPVDPGPTTPPPTGSTPMLKPGSRGSAVKRLQTTLRANGYWHSGSDGVYGQTTQQAVMAVQKMHGLERDGICGSQTWSVVNRLSRPRGRTTSGSAIEVDLSKQVMIFVVSGQTRWVMNTSTGKAGWRTPPGRFSIFRSVNRMDNGPLGALWRPRYFNRGIALHGSPSIPGYPASHGCTRLSNAAVNYVWSANLAPIGRRVWVY